MPLSVDPFRNGEARLHLQRWVHIPESQPVGSPGVPCGTSLLPRRVSRAREAASTSSTKTRADRNSGGAGSSDARCACRQRRAKSPEKLPSGVKRWIRVVVPTPSGLADRTRTPPLQQSTTDSRGPSTMEARRSMVRSGDLDGWRATSRHSAAVGRCIDRTFVLRPWCAIAAAGREGYRVYLRGRCVFMSDKPFHNPFAALGHLRGDGPLPEAAAPAPSPEAPGTAVARRAVVRIERAGRGGKEVTVVDH